MKHPSPTPDQIKAGRLDAALTQTEAARVIHKSCRAWQQYEAGDRVMDPALWELFNLKAW